MTLTLAANGFVLRDDRTGKISVYEFATRRERDEALWLLDVRPQGQA